MFPRFGFSLNDINPINNAAAITTIATYKVSFFILLFMFLTFPSVAHPCSPEEEQGGQPTLIRVVQVVHYDEHVCPINVLELHFRPPARSNQVVRRTRADYYVACR